VCCLPVSPKYEKNKCHNLTNITLQVKISNRFFSMYAIQSLKINLSRQDDTCYKERFAPSQNLLDLLTAVSPVQFNIRPPCSQGTAAKQQKWLHLVGMRITLDMLWVLSSLDEVILASLLLTYIKLGRFPCKYRSFISLF